MYELINGRTKGSTRLPAVAFALGLHGVWLLDEQGPRLIGEREIPANADDAWPLPGVDRKRFERAQPRDIQVIVASINGILGAIDGNDESSAKKASR